MRFWGDMRRMLDLNQLGRLGMVGEELGGNGCGR